MGDWENGPFLATWGGGGGPHELATKRAKMQGSQGRQGQNERKAHKAKMQGNEGPQGQNERK